MLSSTEQFLLQDTQVGSYKGALAVLISVLAMKLVVTTLVTVRCRIVSGQFRPIKEDGESAAMGFLINYVFKSMLFVCPLGPGQAAGAEVVESVPDDPTLEAWLGIHRNAAEQEPWFVALAFAYPFVAGGGAFLWAASMPILLVYVYLACRVLHMLCYAGHIQPFRTICFVSGLVTTLVFAVCVSYACVQAGSYERALAVLIAGLAIKLVITTLVTVRCRIVSGQFRPIREDAESAAMGFIINYVFKALLFVCPLGAGQPAGMQLVEGGGQDTTLEAWLGIHRNATEQEPWFMALTLAYALAGSGLGPWWFASVMTSLVYVYLACRVLHMLCYAGHIQPFRTISFVSGLVTTLIFAIFLAYVAVQLAPQERALAVLIAGLAIKLVVTTLVTVRCRIVSGQFRPIKEDGESVAMGFLINYVFKALLLVCPLGAGKAADTQLVEDAGEDATLAAWLGIHRNATEQESWFMAVAFAYALVASSVSSLWAASMAQSLVYVYLACRMLHLLCYSCHLQPFRTIFFVSGLVTTLVFATFLLYVGVQRD